MNPKRIKRKIFADERGSFSEAFRSSDWEQDFVQDNISVSKTGTLRGLHHQKNNPQGKLVTVVLGEIQDVVVEIKTKKVYSFDLKMGETLWVPPNFLHGFLSLSDSIVFYKCTNYYDAESDTSVDAFDESLNIEWKLSNNSISRSVKDTDAKGFDGVFR
jgi:dTDP-4-dehydrorhamnose 3,5-epimerase|tara:strand:- start:3621 stop:4097 length:477 start_codon:yes stop_codon:yes gene_type:complete